MRKGDLEKTKHLFQEFLNELILLSKDEFEEILVMWLALVDQAGFSADAEPGLVKIKELVEGLLNPQ